MRKDERKQKKQKRRFITWKRNAEKKQERKKRKEGTKLRSKRGGMEGRLRRSSRGRRRGSPPLLLQKIQLSLLQRRKP